MRLLICFLVSVFSFDFVDYSDPMCLKEYRPVIGMVAIPNDEDFQERPNTRAFLRSTYVRFFESAGMRVVPILYNSSFEEIDDILKKVNGMRHLGVVFTGGSTKLSTYVPGGMIYSQFMTAIDYIVDKTIEKNKSGQYFPLMGICLGLEVLSIAISDSCVLTATDAWNYTANVYWTEKVPTSKLFKNANPKTLYFLNQYNMTNQNHNWGVTPETFKSKSYLDDPKLNSFFEVLGYSIDMSGKPYIAFMESKRYPIYAFMFHPEKPA